MAKILVVEDDAGMRGIISRILRQAGHEVAEAKNGLEGMDLSRADRPDIVVTDIFMPKMEGMEIIQNLRREHPSMSILAISGGPTTVPDSASAASYLPIAAGLGADATLAKPFRAEDLLREIDKLLQGQTPEPEPA